MPKKKSSNRKLNCNAAAAAACAPPGCETQPPPPSPVCVLPSFQPKPIDVQVITHHMQRYAVWFGGSMLASTVSVSNSRRCTSSAPRGWGQGLVVVVGGGGVLVVEIKLYWEDKEKTRPLGCRCSGMKSGKSEIGTRQTFAAVPSRLLLQLDVARVRLLCRSLRPWLLLWVFLFFSLPTGEACPLPAGIQIFSLASHAAVLLFVCNIVPREKKEAPFSPTY